ncbi:MAG: rod shape-determining protein MreC [Deltaproteobacteria bacterium]|nr:MAG: rod shape-determining protein MreC [Deltaproteobacteria bacterium]
MRPQPRFRTSLLITATLLLIISLLSLSVKRSPVLEKVEGVVVSMAAPGLQGLHYLGRTLAGVWEGYFNLVGVQRENAALKRRLDEYAQKEVRYQEAQQTLARLESLLDLKKEVALPVVGAHVIAYDPSLWSRCALLDQGRDQGVRRGQPVLTAQGIAGRIVEVYPHYSKVMLIVDRSSNADAMVQRTRVRGILQGKGGNRCSLGYVPKSADVQTGDLVLASGLGGVFPKGQVFGKVSGANKKTPGVFQEIEVTPVVDLSALEEVVVVKVVNLAASP